MKGDKKVIQFLNKALAIDFDHALVRGNPLVHQGLRERRLVALIMAEAAIAPHVDHHVAVEPLAKLDRHLAGEGHCLGIVAVDVKHRRLHALRHVRRIG